MYASKFIQLCMYHSMHITVPDGLKALIYIGAVASAILFPLGLLIVIYHYYEERGKGILFAMAAQTTPSIN